MRNERMIKLRGDRTQKEIAEKVGIPVSTYAMIETGRRFPRHKLALSLAQFYGVTVDFLFFAPSDHETRSKRTA